MHTNEPKKKNTCKWTTREGGRDKCIKSIRIIISLGIGTLIHVYSLLRHFLFNIHVHVCLYVYTLAFKHTHVHKHTQAHTHAHTHTQQTHTNTQHTHTNTQHTHTNTQHTHTNTQHTHIHTCTVMDWGLIVLFFVRGPCGSYCYGGLT